MPSIVLPPDYLPSEDEPYMNETMVEYFRQKLLRWREELLHDSSSTLENMSEEGGILEPDLNDRASVETDRALELRTRDRERKLIGKINEALERIDQNEYGFCDETGDPIGVKRLEARPTATLTIAAQEKHERMERTQRDE